MNLSASNNARPCGALPGRSILASSALLLVVACGDSTTLDTGGGAGDGPDDPEAVALLEPFVGLYDLTGNWRGVDGDAATLVIREPAPDGTATVVLYDIDEIIGNCTTQPREGEAIVDRFTGSPLVFLNRLFSFDSAVLTRSANGTLTINHVDVEDVDNDGDTGERVSYTAPRIDGLLESGLPQRC